MPQQKSYPTVAALVQARAMKRMAAKYADLDLGRRASFLHKEALSALKKRQSALSSPPQDALQGEGTSTTPAPDPKSLKDRARLPSPSELNDWPGLDETLEKLLAEKRKEG